MPNVVPPGLAVRARVPATSANLGPGFDCLGLALDITDVVDVVTLVEAAAPSLQVEGEGAGSVATDESHLVLRALRAGVALAGWTLGGVQLRCRNAIPHRRGLGSSAAAVIAGLVAARALVLATGDEGAAVSLSDEALLRLATEFEHHPDNAAAALFGGATIAWCHGEDGGTGAVRLEPHPGLHVQVLIPDRELATARARAALPRSVSHADATFTLARAALLVEALTRRPDLLLEATRDRLHQQQRAEVMPETMALIGRLREAGHAAVLSGAGPSIVVLDGGMRPPRLTLPPGWVARAVEVAREGARTQQVQAGDRPTAG